MAIVTDNITRFFDQLKTLTFWKRLFGWKSFQSLCFDAYEEIKALIAEHQRLGQERIDLSSELALASKEIELLRPAQNALETEKQNLQLTITSLRNEITDLKKTDTQKDDALKQNKEADIQKEIELRSKDNKIADFETAITKLTSESATKDETIKQQQTKMSEMMAADIVQQNKVSELTIERDRFKSENASYKQTENTRRDTYEKNFAAMTAIQTKIQADRDKEIQDRQQQEVTRFAELKQTWANHQESVKGVIKGICEKRGIEYVDSVPFRGDPDNTIKICDEYVIFDAKSPASDDLSNFPTYVKSQAEGVKKYVKEGGVRKTLFLVVPSNTLEVIDRFSYDLADYVVYVVTLDSLEPIILALKQLEVYEFVDQLSPEEREDICRIIGEFAHLTKRRIQIDNYMGRLFLDLLSKSEANLPEDIRLKVIEFEKSAKINPPMEKRAKQIPLKGLDEEQKKIRREAEGRDIAFPESVQGDLKKLPLYKNEESVNGGQ